MPALQMLITDAGLEAIVNAQGGGTDTILIDAIGLTDTPFIMAPTLTAVPGEFRRVDTVSGQAVAENIIHVVAYDPAAIAYDVTGFGLFDADGTLIAVYSTAADPILSKAELATSLFAMDIVLAADVAAVIEFGDALFLNPPATETVAGVAKIATDALADAGVDDLTIMSPKKVKRIVDARVVPATETVSGIVKLATDAQADAGADDTAAMTPAMVQRMIDKALHHKIVAWSGAVVDIEPGWQLCDGTGVTPDLTNSFIIGAGGTYAVGATGGTATHGHGGATAQHVLTEAEMPSHRHHNVTAASGIGPLTGANSIFEASTGGGDSEYSLDGTAGEPTIGRTSAVGGGGGHDHGIAAANHLPPYYALAFIMKV